MEFLVFIGIIVFVLFVYYLTFNNELKRKRYYVSWVYNVKNSSVFCYGNTIIGNCKYMIDDDDIDIVKSDIVSNREYVAKETIIILSIFEIKDRLVLK